MKKTATLGALLLALALPLAAQAETVFAGEVTAGTTQVIAAPYGGLVEDVRVRVGDSVKIGDPIATVETRKTYASTDGTVSGVFAREGDSADGVKTQYGALVYIEPINRYTLECSTEKGYNSSENRYIHIGESVFLKCTKDGSHQGRGVVTGLDEKDDSKFTVEVTGGEFYMGETVDIYRSGDYASASRIGRGTVGRTKTVAVNAEGSVLRMHVKAGDKVAIPNDVTNGGRALLLLQDLGILTLKEGVGLEATEQDIVENPHNVTIKAMEAANLPASLPDLDFAVINGNYASGAGIGDKVLTTEDAESVAAQTYGNVVAVKEGRENDPAVQALVAVLMSGDVQAWIEESYNGVVMPMGAQELDIPEIAEPVTLKVGASPSPHAEILEHVKPLLAEHNVELDIVEFDDYVMPNTGVEDGSLDANYFQHQPYLDDFNAEQSTHIVSVATVHYEPMGIYPGKTASLDVFGK